jgi:putative transposase
LSLDEKMYLAETYAEEFGLNRTLAALHLSKGTWQYRRTRCSYEEKYAQLRDPLMDIARQHPEYGYRKATVELHERGWPTNHKVVQKLQKCWDLAVLRAVRPPRQSAIREALHRLGDRINIVVGLEAIGIFDVLYTDFTELPFDRGRRKAQLMPIIDHTSKLVVGWAVGLSANTDLALEAYDRARGTLRRFGVDPRGVTVHHDQDPVYTSHEWIRTLRLVDGVRISYSLDGARQNTHMESFNGHFKGENESIFWEISGLDALRSAVQTRLVYYNDIRRHASLDNVSPLNFLKNHGFEPRPGVSPN